MNKMQTNLIKEHYDKVSPYYQKFWGNHLHHGYYLSGNESKEKAQENLIKVLVNKANIKKQSEVLDIGCGVGGTSVWLARNCGCKVTGITISPIQVKIAKNISSFETFKFKPNFIIADANNLNFNKKYDILWAVEMTSHLNKRKEFFKKCVQLLNKNGKLIIADWFKNSDLDKEKIEKYIIPIEKGMLVSLWTSKDYLKILTDNGLNIKYHKDISQNVKKTWEIGLDIIKKKEFWILAMKNGKEFIQFLKAFDSMKKGFDSGAFTYEIMVLEK